MAQRGQLELAHYGIGPSQARLTDYDHTQPDSKPPLTLSSTSWSECTTYQGDVCCLDCTNTLTAGKLIEHLLTDHPDIINERLSTLAKHTTDTLSTTNGDERIIHTPEPAFLNQTPDPTPGSDLTPTDPRACDECGQRMSASYARVFASHVDGVMHCPDCLPRSIRYTNDPVYANAHESNPQTQTGTDNSRYRDIGQTPVTRNNDAP